MFPLARTIRSLLKADLLRLMMACALLAILMVVGIVALATWTAGVLIQIRIGWLDGAVTWLVGMVTGVAGWFMLPALTVLIGGIFQETVIQRVERRDYAGFSTPGAGTFWMDLLYDLGFTLKAIALNLLVLPLYFLGIGLPVSIALNTYLLGREFFEIVAGHHYGKASARKLRRAHPRHVYVGGLVITLVSLTPLLNLFVPVIAVVWMVHAFHSGPAAPPEA